MIQRNVKLVLRVGDVEYGEIREKGDEEKTEAGRQKKKRRRGWEEGQRDKGEASRAKWKGKEERRRETKRTLMRTWHLVTEGFNI